MTRHDHQGLDPRSGFMKPGECIDALIRPCIRKAFPLPEADHDSDDRFRVLLQALAQRGGRAG